MSTNQQKWTVGIVLFLFVAFCWTQEDEEKNRYSKTTNSVRRHHTITQDKNAGIFLPLYNEIAQDRDKGITWDDWRKQLLSEDRFIELDTNGDELISREELAHDPLQGETQVVEQGDELIKQVCKKEIPDYAGKLQNLKKNGFRNIGKSVEYVVDKPITTTPVEICQYPGCNELATKLFIHAQHGQELSKKVCVGHHTLLFLKEQEQRSSLEPYIFMLIVLGLAVAVSLMAPALIPPAKS